MEERLIPIIDEKIKDLDVHVDSIKVEKEDNETYLRIALDADFIIDLNTVVKATRIINTIIDKENIELENYNLDIYAKPKGDIDNG